MKNNLLFLIVLIALLTIGFGALFYVYRFGGFEADYEPTTEEAKIERAEDLPSEEELIEQELDSQPEISNDDDLETIWQELEETVILEEDFSDI